MIVNLLKVIRIRTELLSQPGKGGLHAWYRIETVCNQQGSRQHSSFFVKSGKTVSESTPIQGQWRKKWLVPDILPTVCPPLLGPLADPRGFEFVRDRQQNHILRVNTKVFTQFDGAIYRNLGAIWVYDLAGMSNKARKSRMIE